MFPIDDYLGRGGKDIIEEVNRKGAGIYICNPGTGEAEPRGSQVQGQPEVNSEIVSKTQKWK